MAEGKYMEIDDQIIGNIRLGWNRFNEIYSRMVADIPSRKRYEFRRLIDRRLQSLRKRGLIEFSTKFGWEMRTIS